MLTELISKQTSCLQVLNLGNNGFRDAIFEKLLTGIAECGVCSTLKELDLSKASLLSSKKVREKIADILATAPVLQKCNIEK